MNAHDAVDIGNGQLVSFEKSWPDRFTLLSKLVLTIAVKRKIAKLGNNNVHDTNVIYSGIGLHQSKDVIMKTVLFIMIVHLEDFINEFTRKLLKRVVNQDTRQTIAPHLDITMQVEVVFFKFVDCAPHLAAGV